MSQRSAGLPLIAFATVMLVGSATAQTADKMLTKSATSIARIGLIDPVCGSPYLIDR